MNNEYIYDPETAPPITPISELTARHDHLMEELMHRYTMATLTPEQAEAYDDMRREINTFVLNSRVGENNDN